MEKGSFLLYREYGAEVAMLSDEEAGQFIKAVFAYESGGEAPALSGGAGVLFSIFKRKLDENRQKYQAKCQVNRKNGEKGGRPPVLPNSEENPEKPMGFSENPKNPEPEPEPEPETEKKRTPPKAPQGGREAGFAKFWQAYPRKTAKQAARKAWDKLSPGGDLVEAILAAVERDRRSDQWTREEGRFVPYPASWLNGRRWEDEGTEPDPEPDESPPLEPEPPLPDEPREFRAGMDWRELLA